MMYFLSFLLLKQQRRQVIGYVKYMQAVFKLLGVDEAVLLDNVTRLLVLEATFSRVSKDTVHTRLNPSSIKRRA
jgi:hypothetical protein